MSFVNLVIHGLSAISVFSDVVGVRLLLAALFVVVATVLGVGAVVAVKLLTSGLAIPGWATSTIGLLLVILLQAIALSVIFSFIILANRNGATFLPTRDCSILVDRVDTVYARIRGHTRRIASFEPRGMIWQWRSHRARCSRDCFAAIRWLSWCWRLSFWRPSLRSSRSRTRTTRLRTLPAATATGSATTIACIRRTETCRSAGFALPLLAMDLRLPANEDAWRVSDIWDLGGRFFFDAGNDVEAMLWRARCMNALLAVALGTLVYAWSRRLFGPGGGMLSLLLYATSPTILANGGLATADLAAAAFFTLSVGCLWKMFHTLSLGAVVCVCLATAGLSLSKMSVVLLRRMAAVLLILRLRGRRPLKIIAWKERFVDRWPVQATVLLGVLLLQGVLVVATIWAFYGFRYSAFHPPVSGTEQLFAPRGGNGWESTLTDTGAFGNVIRFARHHHLLPEAYLYGTAFVYRWARRGPLFSMASAV